MNGLQTFNQWPTRMATTNKGSYIIGLPQAQHKPPSIKHNKVMKINLLTILICSITLFSCGIKQTTSEKSNELEKFAEFQKCDIGENDTLLSHEMFEIGFSKNWTTDNVLLQGLDISYIDKDSVYHGFMLSALPYQDVYFAKNQMVDYVRFKKVRFNEMEGIYFVRNDLIPRDNTVYWRGELRLHDPNKQNAYYLVFGIRHDKDQEPNWCIFSPIINSFHYK